MKENLKRMAGYYKPYMGTFMLDMCFAFLASAISLVIPLVVRYITSELPKLDPDTAVNQVMMIGIVLIILVLIQFGSNF